MNALITIVACLIFLASCSSFPERVAKVVDLRQDYVGRYLVEYYIQNNGINQGVVKGPSGIDTLTVLAANSVNQLKFITSTDTFLVQLASTTGGITRFSLSNRQGSQPGSTSFVSGSGFFRHDTISYQRFYSVTEPTRSYNIYYFCYGPGR